MAASDSTAASSSSGSDHSDSNSNPAGVSSPGWSDRVLGIVCMGVGILYTIEARTFDGTAFGSGPVGPKTLPTGIGVLFIALAAYLVIKPDPSPTWPTAKAGWQIGLVIIASYLYGRVLETAGFIFASAAMALIMGLLFKAPIKKLLPLSLIFPVVLAFIFNNWLDLRLPSGWWGGF